VSLPAGALPLGTRVTTATVAGKRSQARVESLRPGDLVALAGAGAEQPAKLAAVARLDAPADDNPRAWPVRIRAGAIGPAVPAVDLLLAPESLLRLGDGDAFLIPAASLCNSRSIVRAKPSGGAWFRPDAGQPGLVRAEGLLVGTAGRAALPILPVGQTLNAIRQAVAARAAEAGHAPEPPPPPRNAPPPPPPAPTIHPISLVSGGTKLALEESDSGHFTTTLPAKTGPVRLRATARRAKDRADTRRFGVCILQLSLDDQPIPFDSPIFGPGFHPPESDSVTTWRWTTDDAWLVLPYTPKPRTLTLHLAPWHTTLALA
jgi:hypothetical protein